MTRSREMGCGTSCSMYSRPNKEEKWYSLDSEESKQWQEEETGFGQARNKSFRKGVQSNSATNRIGNENGELSGKIKFFTIADRKTDYSEIVDNPSFDINVDSKIFAKSFLAVPLGMTPIGESNLSYKKHDHMEGAVNYTGFGPVLLAPVVRAIAMFVKVDGQPQTPEVFCSESAASPDNQMTFTDENDNNEDEARIITSAISGSFVTYCMSRSQDPFFFIQYPILSSHEDCTKIGTGPYALAVAGAFHSMFCSLKPGKHKLDVSIKAFYDHTEFHYFVRDINLNPTGLWYNGLPNEMLKTPHDDPETLITPDALLAEGSLTVTIPNNFTKIFSGFLDRKPPQERYKDDDLDEVRKEAGLVATGRFCKMFSVQGLPDITLLTTKKIDVQSTEKGTGYNHAYDYIEYSACWLDPNDSSPSGMGLMFEGAMAKGEVTPKDYSQTWTWHEVTKGGEIIETVSLDVKNRYILARMVERRKSQTILFDRIKNKLSKLKP